MNSTDESLRDAITDRLTSANVDARNVSVEVVAGNVTATGTVPTEQDLVRLMQALDECRGPATGIDCRIGVRDQPPRDSSDGRGRSPVTGTSADSQHESRHQLDRD